MSPRLLATLCSLRLHSTATSPTTSTTALIEFLGSKFKSQLDINNSNNHSGSISNTWTDAQRTVLYNIFQEMLHDKMQAKLAKPLYRAELVRHQLDLIDLDAVLKASISLGSAQRSSQCAQLSTNLQSTLDSLHDALTDLRSELAIQSKTQRPVDLRRQRLDDELQRREGALAVALGEFRTRCESVKLRAMYTFTMGIAVLFLAVVIERASKRKDQKTDGTIRNFGGNSIGGNGNGNSY